MGEATTVGYFSFTFNDSYGNTSDWDNLQDTLGTEVEWLLAVVSLLVIIFMIAGNTLVVLAVLTTPALQVSVQMSPPCLTSRYVTKRALLVLPPGT